MVTVPGDGVHAEHEGLTGIAGDVASCSAALRSAAQGIDGAGNLAATLGVVGAEFVSAFGTATVQFAQSLTALAETYESTALGISAAARSYLDGDDAVAGALVSVHTP
ncbi:MAG: type VII secretion target [Rhodococcus sp. (in: high G+C Gram-positive bacteria)]